LNGPFNYVPAAVQTDRSCVSGFRGLAIAAPSYGGPRFQQGRCQPLK